MALDGGETSVFAFCAQRVLLNVWKASREGRGRAEKSAAIVIGGRADIHGWCNRLP